MWKLDPKEMCSNAGGINMPIKDVDHKGLSMDVGWSLLPNNFIEKIRPSVLLQSPDPKE